MAPSSRCPRPPTSWRGLTIVAALVARTPSVSSTPMAKRRWSLSPAKLSVGRRNASEGGAWDRSYALHDWDFDDDDYSDHDCLEDEDSLYSARGGATMGGRTGGSSCGARLPGLHNGWRKRSRGREGDWRGKLQRKKWQQIKQLEGLKYSKLSQFRKTFRQKQQQFQTKLYNLNSRLDHDFPIPPYSLWRMDPGPSPGKTTLTGKIFLLNIVVFGIQTVFPKLTAMGAKRSDMILEGRQLYRLLTPIFLHGGIGHLAANSYSLKSMGVNIERAFGRPRLFATYLVSGITGNVFSAIQSPNPAVGASGAIFGLVGAYYTFLSRNDHLFGYTGQMQRDSLIETIGLNLVLGMTNPMIDNWGHIGGFIGGVGMAWLIGPKLYVARIPMGDDNLAVGGFGAGKIVIDRPTIALRIPEAIDEGIYRINEGVRKLGRKVNANVHGLFNRGEQEYFLDRIMDIDAGSVGVGDGTIYRTLKDKNNMRLAGDVNVSLSDGFRQDMSALDPTAAGQHEGRQERRKRGTFPKVGRSIRPRYSHLYR